IELAGRTEAVDGLVSRRLLEQHGDLLGCLGEVGGDGHVHLVGHSRPQRQRSQRGGEAGEQEPAQRASPTVQMYCEHRQSPSICFLIHIESYVRKARHGNRYFHLAISASSLRKAFMSAAIAASA